MMNSLVWKFSCMGSGEVNQVRKSNHAHVFSQTLSFVNLHILHRVSPHFLHNVGV